MTILPRDVPAPPPRLSTLFALGIVTAVTLAEQVVITRLLSAVLAYHFSFLAISIGLLGTGAAALLLYVKPAWFRDPTEQILARWSLYLALTLIVVPIALAQLDFSGAQALDVGFGANLGLATVLAAAPPFASGVVVAVAIARYAASIGRIYAFDLLGAGLGALLVVPVLGLGPAPNLLVALGVAAGLAAASFAPPKTRHRALGIGASCAAALLLVLGGRSPLLYLDPDYSLAPGTVRIAERWTPLARVFGFEQSHPDAPALLFYDRVYAPIPVVSDGEIPDWRRLGTGPASVGFAFAGPGRTLIIGGGGGRDIYNALSSGQRRVDVIELLEGNREVVDVDLAHLSGSPYSRPNVHTVIGDGRSVLAARDTKYDQIHIGFTDTLTANAAQGFALTENNLYTVEAFQAYFDHLTPRGILNVSRLLKLVGDEALRVTVLTLDALRQRGVEDPFQHVIVVLGSDVLGPPTGTVLARLEPFTPSEVEAIRRLADERANGLLMAPGGPNLAEWRELAQAPSIESFCTNYPLDVCAPTDDRPFFFSMGRLGDLGGFGTDGYLYTTSPYTVLLVTLIILLALSAAGFVLPLRLVRAARPPTPRSLVYFAAIGLGFLLLEIVLIQRLVLFLGFPTYALSVVLFSLLVFMGVGSALSSRFSDPRRGLTAALAVGLALVALAAFALDPLLRALIGLPLGVRVLITVALLAPVGLCFGVAMPVGLRRFVAFFPEGVPYAWGVNGITSVLASVLGVFVAIHFGFQVATLVAGACYLVALGHVVFGRWPDVLDAPSAPGPTGSDVL